MCIQDSRCKTSPSGTTVGSFYIFNVSCFHLHPPTPEFIQFLNWYEDLSFPNLVKLKEKLTSWFFKFWGVIVEMFTEVWNIHGGGDSGCVWGWRIVLGDLKLFASCRNRLCRCNWIVEVLLGVSWISRFVGISIRRICQCHSEGKNWKLKSWWMLPFGSFQFFRVFIVTWTSRDFRGKLIGKLRITSGAKEMTYLRFVVWARCIKPQHR